MPRRPSLSDVLGQGKDKEVSGPTHVPARGRPKLDDSRSSRLEKGEFKQLKAIIPAELHRQTKVAAAAQEKEISEIVEEALGLWLEQQGGSSI